MSMQQLRVEAFSNQRHGYVPHPKPRNVLANLTINQ